MSEDAAYRRHMNTYIKLIDDYLAKNEYTNWVHGETTIARHADMDEPAVYRVIYTNKDTENQSYSGMNVDVSYSTFGTSVTIKTIGYTGRDHHIPSEAVLQRFLSREFPTIDAVKKSKQAKIEQDEFMRKEMARTSYVMDIQMFIRGPIFVAHINQLIDAVQTKFPVQFQDEDFKEKLAITLNRAIPQFINKRQAAAMGGQMDDHLWTTIGRLSAILDKSI